jgi:8-oxo-dGTP pyrophosphatase MutT (NUDIX family)
MDIVGISEQDGSRVFAHELGQGADPQITSFDLGYVTIRPIEAVRMPESGRLEQRFLVRPRAGERRPRLAGRGQDAGLDLSRLPDPEVRQRIAAYALVRSSQGLLATEFSGRTGVPGRWGLPGGGLDDEEQPTEAVLREVAEETQQSITLGELVRVQTSHWVGRSPRDTIEDYHAIRLIYEATCEHPNRPVVVDVGGTTESARWVPLSSWPTVPWTVGWRQILAELVNGSS